MNVSQVSLRVILSLAVMFLLPSCEKKRQLQNDLRTQRQTLEENRHLLLALDEEIRATEHSNVAQRNAMQSREKMEAAAKQLKSITTDLEAIKKKIEAADQKQKTMAEELSAYKKQTAQP